MGRRWRFALTGSLAGYLLGLVVAFPAVTIVFGEATIRFSHRNDMYRWGYLGALAGVLMGFAVGWYWAARTEQGAGETGDAGEAGGAGHDAGTGDTTHSGEGTGGP